ncbi:MAG: type III secretory pathway component EscR [Maribacter sp.]|jgi:type III secretory pathway component EscR
MKKVLVVGLFITAVTMAFGQVGQVSPVSIKMSQGVQNGFKILIPEVDGRGASKAWDKLMREYDGKTSSVSKSDDRMSSGVLIPSIQDTTITIYTNFNETPEGVYMHVFINTGNAYISKSSSDMTVIAVKKLLTKFATATAFNAVNQRIEVASKALDKLEKEQRNLEKDKAQYEKEIKRAQETIAKRKKDLETNAKSQTGKKKSILEKKRDINLIKSELGKYSK